MLSSRLRMPFRGFNAFWIITISAVSVTLWSGSIATVYGAPAKLDSNETPFPLELQPPLVDDEAAAAAANDAFNRKPSAFDSYGNPIDALKPIDTPDGRKVVNAQGLQFEIPTYASGITEIKKPADDLLPPFIDPIAVAVPNDSAEVLPTGTGSGIPTTVANSISSRETTTVDIENAELVEITAEGGDQQDGGQIQSQQQQESVHSPSIVEAGTGRSNEIPAYLLDLNDPDIGGPIEYMPNDEGSLKVIAWDLLPPHNIEPFIITKENNQPKRVQGIVDPQTNNIKVSLSSGQGLPVNNIRSSSVTEGKVSTVPLNSQVATRRPEESHTTHFDSQTSPSTNSGSGEKIQFSLGTRAGTGFQQTAVSSEANGQSGEYIDTTTRYNQRQRGNVHYSSTSTTPRSTTVRSTRPTTTTTTTTTTRRPTTTTTRRTTTTTTTRATTTPKPTTTTTAEPLDPSTFYRLAEGDSYTIPSWLADIDDPDLDAAVTFVIPEDLNEYNHTIARDLLPPFEPFIDLDNIHLPEPTEQKTTVVPNTTPRTTTRRTTTTTTTTTHRPTVTTARPNWIRAKPTTTSTPPRSTTTFNSRFTSNHIAPSHAQTIASSSNTFTNSKSSTHASNANTRISTSTTTTTTPTTTTTYNSNNNSFNKKTSYTNAFNQNLPTTTVDPITSSEAAEAAGVKPQKSSNPFLSKPHNDGKYNPAPFQRNSGRPITTTTTTTTTTTPSPLVEENPFNSATVPDWLSSFDYPDVGPGVPFVYDPNDPESAVFNDLLPPSNVEAQATDSVAKPVFITSSPASFNSFQTPTATSNSFATSSATTSPSSSATSNANFQPSKVTLPLPSIQVNRNQNENAAVTQPPIVFIPPPPTAAEDYNGNNDNNNYNNNYNNNNDNAANPNSGTVKNFSSPSFNKNFAAPFEPTGSSEAGPTTPPIAADQEAFPPFGGSGGSATPSKTTFTKSDDGKVITNNVFLPTSTGGGQQPQQQAAKPFGFGNTFGTQQKDFQASQTNQFFTSTTGFSSTASNSVQGSTGFSAGSGFSSGSASGSGFIKTSTPTSFSVQQTSAFGANDGFGGKGSATGNGGRYTGSFGGAPGVLGSGKVGYAVQTDGSIRDPDHTYRSPTGNGATAAASVPVPAPTQPPRPVAPSFTGFGNRVSGSFTPVVGGDSGASSNANKYSGRFGGPPGILVPYDNVKGGQS